MLINDSALVAAAVRAFFDFSTRAARADTSTCCRTGSRATSRASRCCLQNLTDRELDLHGARRTATGSAGGLLGTFDGIYAGYRFAVVPVNANFGYPVESTDDGPNTTGKLRRRVGRFQARSLTRGTSRVRGPQDDVGDGPAGDRYGGSLYPGRVSRWSAGR